MNQKILILESFFSEKGFYFRVRINKTDAEYHLKLRK
jgi:hypothetical protein